MQISREFSPDVAQVLQVIDERVLKALLQNKNFENNRRNQISKQQLKKTFKFLRLANPFQNIENPVDWQKKQRKDRELSR